MTLYDRLFKPIYMKRYVLTSVGLSHVYQERGFKSAPEAHHAIGYDEKKKLNIYHLKIRFKK